MGTGSFLYFYIGFIIEKMNPSPFYFLSYHPRLREEPLFIRDLAKTERRSHGAAQIIGVGPALAEAIALEYAAAADAFQP